MAYQYKPPKEEDQYLIKCSMCNCSFAKHNNYLHIKTAYHKLAEQLLAENPNITDIDAAIRE